MVPNASYSSRLHAHLRPFAYLFRAIVWTSGSFLLLSFTVSALPPSPVSSMAFITIDEKILYIQGGTDPADKNTGNLSVKSKQFFALDLTYPSSWNTSSPPWIQLNSDGDDGPASFGHSLSVSSDHRTITVWDANTISSTLMSYNLDTHKWTKVADRPKELVTQSGIQAVTHPPTGLVYIPSGSNNANGDMLIYDLKKLEIKQVPMPPKGSSNPLEWYGYSFVWCELRQSFLIFGGGGDVGPYFYEFNPIIGAWTEVPLIGDVPPRVKSACFIPAYNGTRMVLFGGLTNSSAAVGGIYFLNISSMAWTLGQAVPSEQNRFGMACAVSGDNFIIWGGQGVTSEGTVKSGTPLIYNMYTSNWTTQFVRETHFTPPYTAPISDHKSSLNTGEAILIGVVVLAIVVFIYYRRRRRRTRNSNVNGKDHMFVRISGSDISLSTFAHSLQEGSTDKTKITNDNVYGRQTRPFGSHSNARLATFAPQIDNGGSTNQIFSVHDSNIIRPLSTAPISTSELPNHTSHYDSASQCIAESMAQTNSSWPPPQLPTNPSWHSTPPSTSTWPSTPPTNPSWPNTSDEEPFAPLSYHSPSSLSVTPSAPLESRTPSSLRYNIHSPSAPPPSYLDSMSTPQNTVFRDETVTEQPRSLHLESLEELYGMHTNGHNVHEQQIEKIEHQLAASKKELDRRSIGLHSYQDSLSPAIYVATVGIPETSTWNSHETRDTIVQGLSNGSSSNSGGDDNNNRNGMSNEELKHQIIALQAELTRLQAMIDQSERK